MAVASMAVGGRGVVSVASNEAPAEMVQIVELFVQGVPHAVSEIDVFGVHNLIPLALSDAARV